MKRGQQVFELRPEAARRKKASSKIQAKLRLRRCSKLENKIERSSRESPRLFRKKNVVSSESFRDSSSENDSPRFLTSKQHVELVDFESRRILPIPRLRKLPQKSVKTQEDFAKNFEAKNTEKPRKSLSQTFVKKEANLVRRTFTDTKIFKSEKSPVNFFKNQEFCNSLNKKRSRSAPCTPLFKIKCAKDKYTRNFLAERKSLVEKSLREEIRRLRKNRTKELRISRSGEVSVSSCEKLTDERIIERSSLEAFENEEKQPESVLITENQQIEENKEEEFINCDNCGNVELIKFQKEVAINEIKSDKNLPVEINFSNDNSVTEKNPTEEEKSPENENFCVNPEILDTKPIKEKKKKNLIGDESVKIVGIVSRLVEEKKREKSPVKPPKKRAFKWETILEKQHRQNLSRSPENRKKSPEILRENRVDNKFNFWSQKAANCSKHCRCPRSRVKSFENRRLEAYSLIREELPKILMKRRQAEAARIEKRIFDGKSNNFSPERPKETFKNHNSPFNSLLIENIGKHNDYKNNLPSDITAKKLSSKTTKSLAKNSPEIPAEVQKNDPPMKIAESPRNSVETNENKFNKIPRASILKNRKTPSPRRVTFRLPPREIMEENLTEETNFNDNETVESSISEIDYSEMPEENIEDNEEFETKEEEVSLNEEENLDKKSERFLDICIPEKERRIRSEKLKNAADTEKSRKVQYFRWISPRLFAGTEEQNCCESEDTEQDWETPTVEDTYRATREISYPKETREAMKILLRAKENGIKHNCQKRMTNREIFQQRKFHLRAANSPEKNSTIVSKSYAKALAKFQECCDLEVGENFFRIPTTLPQHRGSWKTNEAGGK